ncbi:MAG: PorV/PorQ family protein [Candidatus Glassbacteria bacterium]|nr:PorV/PorQ family protein [Candidatus Glassbacteria bacterium]
MRSNQIQSLAAAMLLAAAALGFAQVDQSGISPDPLSGRLKGYSGVGTRSGEFLNIPTDARGVALGEAACASTDDIGAIYWNPANLGFLSGPQVMFTNVNYALDFTYNFVAAAIPFNDGQGIYGGFMGVLTTEPEEITTLIEPTGSEEYFDGYNMVVGGTFAYNISDRFSAGINVKWVHEDIWDITANAFALDIGANYHTEFMDHPIRVAFAVNNLGSNLRYTGEKLSHNYLPDDELGRNLYLGTPRQTRTDRYGYLKTNSFNLPVAFKLGVAYLPYQDEYNNIMVACEYMQPNYLQAIFSLGTEYKRSFGVRNVVAARCGWKIRRDEIDLEGADKLRGLSLGGGLAHDFVVFTARADYAYADNGRLGGLHFISLTLSF